MHRAIQLYFALWHNNGNIAIIAHVFLFCILVCAYIIFYSRIRIRRDWPTPTTLDHNAGYWTPDAEEIREEHFYDIQDRRR